MIYTNFLTLKSTSLFCGCKKVFTLMNTWMIGKNSMKLFPLSEKDYFYSHLNMEDITDLEYTHAKRVFKDFKINNLGKYCDLYFQIDT